MTNEVMTARANVLILNNEEFGSIRSVQDEDKILFCGSDVAKALGYANVRDAIIRHCRCVVKHDIPHPQSAGKTIEMSFITEGDVYRLIAHSKLPAAERFESWVFDEVLPTLRKNGSYTITRKLDSYMIEDPVERAKRWIEECEEKKALEQKLVEQQPMVEYAEHIQKSEDSIDMGSMAKIACKNGIDIGRNNLFKLLRYKGILMDNNDPYQEYINRGWFEVVEHIFVPPIGKVKISKTTLVKPKGQVGIVNMLRKHYSVS